MSNDEKLYSPACERNAPHILNALKNIIAEHSPSNNTDKSPFNILEVGSGSGQHAATFAPALKNNNVVWQPSDLPDQLSSIRAWVKEVTSDNCLSPIALDLTNTNWAEQCQNQSARYYDMLFTANTLHIVSWPLVCNFLSGATRCVTDEGLLLVYGPFNYDGRYTSESNEAFDAWLKNRDPKSGIRDRKNVIEQAKDFALVDDIEMPANNRLLVFRKRC